MTARRAKTNWRDTPAADAKYRERRAEAQAKANEFGYDYGIECNEVFRDFMVYMLPEKKNRYGHELRCEVVSCENLAKTQRGHGPGGYTSDGKGGRL